MEDFFKGLKVIELANVLAGPAVGMFFAELGAEVIKIENRLTNGDVTRTWKLNKESPSINYSAYYASVNWNKKTHFKDLTNKTDKEFVLELIRNADIVISNYKPGDDIKLGLDYETLKKINETLIYAHLTGFGEKSRRTAYDLILQAETGYMYMNGDKNSSPLKMPVALIDVLAAHQMKEAILIALIKKLKENKGSKISVSLYDSAIASLANQASNWLMTKHDPQPIGSLHPNIAPYGEIFITADNQKIVFAIGNDKQFHNLCEQIGYSELKNNELFLTNFERVQNREKLQKTIQEKISFMNSSVLMEKLIEKDVPAGIIKPISSVFKSNENERLILTEKFDNEEVSRRVRTAVFSIK